MSILTYKKREQRLNTKGIFQWIYSQVKYLWTHLPRLLELMPSVIIIECGTSIFKRYVAIATQPVHRLQIRPIVHN